MERFKRFYGTFTEGKEVARMCSLDILFSGSGPEVECLDCGLSPGDVRMRVQCVGMALNVSAWLMLRQRAVLITGILTAN